MVRQLSAKNQITKGNDDDVDNRLPEKNDPASGFCCCGIQADDWGIRPFSF
jgi:hypothetical protein